MSTENGQREGAGAVALLTENWRVLHERYVVAGPNVTRRVQQPAVEAINAPGGRVYFAPDRRGRGRPKRVARDVAVYAACSWFHADRPMPGVSSNVRSAITAVQELWAASGYRGLSDYKETVRVAMRGQEVIFGQGLDACVREDGAAEGALAFFVPDSAVRKDAAGRIQKIDLCIGWAWVFGSEEAQRGRISTCRDDFSP